MRVLFSGTFRCPAYVSGRLLGDERRAGSPYTPFIHSTEKKGYLVWDDTQSRSRSPVVREVLR